MRTEGDEESLDGEGEGGDGAFGALDRVRGAGGEGGLLGAVVCEVEGEDGVLSPLSARVPVALRGAVDEEAFGVEADCLVSGGMGTSERTAGEKRIVRPSTLWTTMLQLGNQG